MFWVEEPRANMKLRLGYMIQDRLSAEMRRGRLADEKAWDIIADTTATFFPQFYPPQVVDLGGGLKVLREPRERHV